MTYYNSKRLVTLLTLIASIGTAVAADEVQCGAADHENATGLLNAEFRALLSGSSQEIRDNASGIVVRQNNAPVSHAPCEPSGVITASPTSLVSPVAKKRLPRTCVLRDPDNKRELLTLTIPSDVSAEPIAPEELAAQRKEEELLKNDSYQAAHQSRYDHRPRLMIRRDGKSIHVDAHSSDVRDVLRGISSRTGKRILFHPDLEGTISATTKAEGIVVLIRTMLEPFNFSVIASTEHLIVCGPNETPGSVLAAISKRNTVQVDTSRIAKTAPTTRQPPQQATPQTQPAPTAPRLNPVLHPAKDQAIQLVAAQTQPITPLQLRPSKPPAAPTTESLAAERIARVAQDAFAAGQTEYAGEVLEQGLMRFPSSVMLRRILGESLYLEGKFAEAAEVLTAAIELDKHEPMANELMGKTLKALGQKQRAYHYFLQAQQGRQAAR